MWGWSDQAGLCNLPRRALSSLLPFTEETKEAEGNEDFAGEDRKDAFAAFQLLKQHKKVKKDRIHIFGFSRGGIMGIWTAVEMKQEHGFLCHMGRLSVT